MKKTLFFCATMAMMMASCTSEDVVNPAEVTDKGVAPMSFSVLSSNQSRGNLQDVCNNFGVWAIKGANAAEVNALTGWASSPLLVMNDYRVNWDTDVTPNAWVYEGVNDQFLKYWDGSYAKTYFFAYAPSTEAAVFDIDGTNPSITFPAYTLSSTTNIVSVPNLMYSYADCNTEDYMVAGPAVSMAFKRLLSQVQIAFYEDIPGYDVKMGSVVFNGTIDPRGVVAIPAVEGSLATNTRGEYIKSGKPTVTYDLTAGTQSVTCASTSTDDADIDFSSALIDNPLHESGAAIAGNIVPEKVASGIQKYGYSPTVVSMLPGKHCAFQFVVNYTLMSNDTNEEINVRGARVLVPMSCFDLKSNHRHTFVFKITKNSTGTTTKDDPEDQPEEVGLGLFPIVFAGLTVEDMQDDVDHDHVIN